MKNISIKEIFKKSWRDFKQNWLVLVFSVFVFVVLLFILQFSGFKDEMYYETITMQQLYIHSSLGFVAFVVSIYLGITFTRTYLKITDGKQVKFLDFFTNIKGVGHFFKYLGTAILAAILIVAPAIILASIMGVVIFAFGTKPEIVFFIGFGLIYTFVFIASIFLMFTTSFSAENRYHFFKAITKSFKIIKNSFWKFILLIITSFVINIVGALALLVGLLVTVPITYLMFFHFYRVADPEVEIVEVENENEDIKIA